MSDESNQSTEAQPPDVPVLDSVAAHLSKLSDDMLHDLFEMQATNSYPLQFEKACAMIGSALTEELRAEIVRLKSRVATLEDTLRRIVEWDCLHPEPRVDLCSDLAWLKTLIDDALKTE